MRAPLSDVPVLLLNQLILGSFETLGKGGGGGGEEEKTTSKTAVVIRCEGNTFNKSYATSRTHQKCIYSSQQCVSLKNGASYITKTSILSQ